MLLKYPGWSWYFVSQLEKNIHEIKNKFPRIYKKVFPIQRVAGLEFTHDDNQKLVNCLTFMLKGLGEINSLTTYSQTFASTIEKNKRQFTTHVNDVKYNELCRALSIATKRLNKRGANLLEGEERLSSICQRAEMLFTRLLKESMGETDIPYGNGRHYYVFVLNGGLIPITVKIVICCRA